MNDIDTQFMTWKQQPSPKTVTPLVKSLEPTIDRALKTYGFSGDPNMKTTAQLHIIKSLPRYDPKKAKLTTFVFNELKRLQRIGPKQRYAIPIPEQAAFDLKSVQKIEHDLAYDLGRDPTHEELADATGLSSRRIASLRKRYGLPTLTERSFETEEGFVNMPGMKSDTNDSEQLWMEAIYHELNPIDKQILDWSIGWHNQDKLSKTQMAKRLNISIPAITQRAKRIAQRLSEGSEYMIL